MYYIGGLFVKSEGEAYGRIIKKALEEIYEKEFEKYKVTKPHFFSFRHRRMMRKLFKQLENKSKQSKRNAPESDKESDDTFSE